MSQGMKRSGSPSPMSWQELVGGTAKCIGAPVPQKANPSGDLLARTIACRPPNEDRIRGMVA